MSAQAREKFPRKKRGGRRRGGKPQPLQKASDLPEKTQDTAGHR